MRLKFVTRPAKNATRVNLRPERSKGSQLTILRFFRRGLQALLELKFFILSVLWIIFSTCSLSISLKKNSAIYSAMSYYCRRKHFRNTINESIIFYSHLNVNHSYNNRWFFLLKYFPTLIHKVLHWYENLDTQSVLDISFKVMSDVVTIGLFE